MTTKTRREVKLRPAVARFAQRMERMLRAHDALKGRSGWKGCKPVEMADRMIEESRELRDACDDGHPLVVIEEAVDVANMAMMVVETVVAGAPKGSR